MAKAKAITGAARSKMEDVAIAQAEAPALEHVSWIHDSGLRTLYFWAFIICIASATTGYDSSMLNNLRILEDWKTFFKNPLGSELGLLTALYNIGSIISLPFVPFMADNFGRRLPIAVGCVLMIVGAAIQGCAQNLSMFMAGRCLLGFGNSLAQLSSPLLLTELCHPQHRGRLTAIYNCLWNVGAIVCTWLTFGTKRIPGDWSWRVPAVTQGLPSIVQLIFIFFIPESPRFLIYKERHNQALHILAKYHANGNMNHPTVQFEYEEIKATLRIELEARKTSSYLDFLRTKGNRYRLLLLCSLGLFSQWSGNALVSYYATDVYNSIGITSSDTQLGLNGGLTILSLIISTSCALLVDKVGRRPLFLASTGGMLICFIIWTVASSFQERTQSKAAGSAVIVMIWIYQVMYALAWTGLLVAYTVEILPYQIRAKGLMLMNFWIQVALTINNYLNPLGFQHLKPNWKFYVIYTGWIFLELVVVYLFYVETRGPTLEEIAKIFDGPGAVGQVNIEKIQAVTGSHYEMLDYDRNGSRVHHRERFP